MSAGHGNGPENEWDDEETTEVTNLLELMKETGRSSRHALEHAVECAEELRKVAKRESEPQALSLPFGLLRKKAAAT